MFALDLFNNDHERRLAEGAVDQLEQRRIDDLAMKMDDLVARAKQVKDPAHKAALVREFQKVKAERDGYFKIKDECMGYGGLVGEAGLPDVADKATKMARLNQPGRAGSDAVTPQQRVNPNPNKGIIGHAADWLRGKGGPGKEGPTYEGQIQKKNSKEVNNLQAAAKEFVELINDRTGPIYQAYYRSFPKGSALEAELRKRIASKYGVPEKELANAEASDRARRMFGNKLNEGQRLHVGDPIVVTAPNEFEGKTGEIYEFSPSGTFVIVNLYNHGRHSMHLSDVEYNDYADKQEEEDDWYDEGLDEGAMSELDIMRQDLERMNERQFFTAYGISKQAFQQKYRTLLNPAPQQDTPVDEGWSDAIVAQRTGQPRTPYSVYIKGKKWKDFENDDHAEAVANKLRAKFRAEGRDPSVITIAPTDYDKDLKEAGSPAQQAAIAIAMKKAGKKPKHLDELDVNTLKSYADKRGAQVAAMKVDNPDATPGSKEWIQQAVPGMKVARAKQKIARKERPVAENDDYDDGEWDDMPDAHVAVKAKQPTRYPEQVLRAIERNPAMRADIIADYQRKQDVAEDGSNYQQQQSMRVPAPNAVGDRYQKNMFATPQQALAQQTNLRTGANPPTKWKKLNTTTAQDLGVRVDGQYVPAPNGGITVKGMATSYDNKTQFPYALTIDANHQIRYKNVDKLNDDELDAVFQNLASNGLLDRKYINPLKAQIQEQKEKELIKKHGQDQEYIRKDPILNYGGGIDKVKGAVKAAKSKNPTAKNDVEAMFAQIGDESQLNQQQEKAIDQLSRRLSQAETENQQQSELIVKLSNNLKQAVAPQQQVAQQQPVQQPIKQNQGVEEVAPPGAKAERMVKHIKKSLSKDGKLSDKDKAIAYATTWKAHNAGKVEEGVMSNVHAAMADVYHRLAPKIERHRDSFLAGQLYDELENIAELHGIEPEFKRMMAGARNRAHMDYDTNPGGFQNWFWYLPFADDEEELAEEQDTSGVESAIIRRIMVAHTDLLKQFGPQKVMQAAEEVAYNVGNVDEIGTSDVSAYVNQVRQILGAPEEQLDETVDTFLDNSARDLLGVAFMIGVPFAVSAYYNIRNKLQKYQGYQIIKALEDKGITMNQVTYKQVAPVLDQFKQALASNDGQQAKQLAQRIEQMIVMGKLSAPEPQAVDKKADAKLDEKWSQKYKSSINCANPKGFSQRAHCASKKK